MRRDALHTGRMERLLVCGWDVGEARSLQGMLAALRREAALEAVAVGDRQPSALVHARAALGLPCYQHLREMIRTTDSNAVLFATPDLAVELAADAAARGRDLLLLGDQMDGAALDAAATATIRYGVALAVLRPALRGAGLTFLTDLIEADQRWTPVALHLELRGDRAAHSMLRDLVAATTRLMHATPTEVFASVGGRDRDNPVSMAAHLRFEDDRLVTLSARPGLSDRIVLSADTAAGSIELDAADGDSRLTLAPWDGDAQRSLLRDQDSFTLEARHVSAVRGDDALDQKLAHREAALLYAIEAAATTGILARVEDPGTRSTLRVLAGGALGATPRLGQLRVVAQ